jgi:hypothetical protein
LRNSVTNTDCHSYCNCYANSYSYTYCYSNSDGNCYANCDANAYSDPNTYTNPNPDIHSYTRTNSDSHAPTTASADSRGYSAPSSESTASTVGIEPPKFSRMLWGFAGPLKFREADPETFSSADEYVWCQSYPGRCNMYNNASYRKYSVSGTTNFTFSAVGSTMRMQPAIRAWTPGSERPPGDC